MLRHEDKYQHRRAHNLLRFEDFLHNPLNISQTRQHPPRSMLHGTAPRFPHNPVVIICVKRPGRADVMRPQLSSRFMNRGVSAGRREAKLRHHHRHPRTPVLNVPTVPDVPGAHIFDTEN